MVTLDFLNGECRWIIVFWIGQVIGNILGHPLEFLSGQSCNSICAPTWDFVCYIENFCVAHLLKFVMVAMLVYLVLLYLYLLYNLGICQCICHTLFRVVWACFATSVNFCCTYLCHELLTVKMNGRRRRKRDIESIDEASSTGGEEYELDENIGHRRSRFSRKRNYKDEHLRRSLRATNHRARVDYFGNSLHMHRRRTLKSIGDIDSSIHHHIRVARRSRFSHKGVQGRNRIHSKRM